MKPCSSALTSGSGGSERLPESTFWRDSTIESALNCIIIQTEFFTPFGNALGLSAKDNDSIVPSVTLLSSCRNPSAVVSFIISIRVNAIQLPIQRRLSHVMQEVGEVLPSFTNRNSAPTVIF